MHLGCADADVNGTGLRIVNSAAVNVSGERKVNDESRQAVSSGESAKIPK